MTMSNLKGKHQKLYLPAAVLCLAFLALAAIQPASAASDETPPGLKEYQQVGKQALQSIMPESLAGMKRAHVIAHPPMMSGAVYSGGTPLNRIAVMLSSAPGDRFQSAMRKRVEQGKATAVTRSGRTVYITGPAVESVKSGAPGLAVAVGNNIISIRGKPPKGEMPAAEAIRTQLASVLSAVDIDALANFSAADAMLSSAHIEVSGGVNATLHVTGAQHNFMGGFTDSRWSIDLSDDSRGMGVRLFYLPADIEPGTYELHEKQGIMSPEHGTLTVAAFRVADKPGNPHPGYWDENVTGTLTVESIENGRMSGHFAFKAYRDDAPPVRVKGQFEDLVILDGELSGT